RVATQIADRQARLDDDADLAAVTLLARGDARLDARERVLRQHALGVALVDEAVLEQTQRPVRHHHRPDAPPPSKLPPPPELNPPPPPKPPPTPPPPKPPGKITGPPKPPRPPPPRPITPTTKSAMTPATAPSSTLAVSHQPIAPTAAPVARAPTLRPITPARRRPTIGTPTKRKIARSCQSMPRTACGRAP